MDPTRDVCVRSSRSFPHQATAGKQEGSSTARSAAKGVLVRVANGAGMQVSQNTVYFGPILAAVCPGFDHGFPPKPTATPTHRFEHACCGRCQSMPTSSTVFNPLFFERRPSRPKPCSPTPSGATPLLIDERIQRTMHLCCSVAVPRCNDTVQLNGRLGDNSTALYLPRAESNYMTISRTYQASIQARRHCTNPAAYPPQDRAPASSGAVGRRHRPSS